MNSKKSKFNKEKFKAIPRSIAQHSFVAFFVFFLISLMIGFFVYYAYFFLVNKMDLEATRKPIQFEDVIFQNILNQWQEREKRFKDADIKIYPNLFLGGLVKEQPEIKAENLPEPGNLTEQ